MFNKLCSKYLKNLKSYLIIFIHKKEAFSKLSRCEWEKLTLFLHPPVDSAVALLLMIFFSLRNVLDKMLTREFFGDIFFYLFISP